MSAAVTAMILAGGLGTRLREVVSDRPKPLATVGERPFIYLLLDQLADAGVTRAVLCTGHLGEGVPPVLGEHHRSLDLRYVREARPLGTGGALRDALLAAGDAEHLLCLNGDSYLDVDLAAFLRWHLDAPTPAASIVVTEVEDRSSFGAVEVDDDGRVLAFREKREGAGPGFVNAGIYVFGRAAIEGWSRDTPLSLERDVLPGCLREGLRAYRSRATLFDIGTPDTYRSAVARLAHRNLSTPVRK